MSAPNDMPFESVSGESLSYVSRDRTLTTGGDLVANRADVLIDYMDRHPDAAVTPDMSWLQPQIGDVLAWLGAENPHKTYGIAPDREVNHDKRLWRGVIRPVRVSRQVDLRRLTLNQPVGTGKYDWSVVWDGLLDSERNLTWVLPVGNQIGNVASVNSTERTPLSRPYLRFDASDNLTIRSSGQYERRFQHVSEIGEVLAIETTLEQIGPYIGGVCLDLANKVEYLSR